PLSKGDVAIDAGVEILDGVGGDLELRRHDAIDERLPGLDVAGAVDLAKVVGHVRLDRRAILAHDRLVPAVRLRGQCRYDPVSIFRGQRLHIGATAQGCRQKQRGDATPADRAASSRTCAIQENRCAARSRILAANASRLRGGAFVSSERNSSTETSAILSTAARNAASLAFDGLLKPVTLRTNCSDAARTSSSVTGGWKLKSS